MIEVKFIISVIAGIIPLITLLINSDVFVKSKFPFSKRSISCFWLLKALITGRPVKVSLTILLRVSIKVCILLKRGIDKENINITTVKIATIEIANIQEIEILVLKT